MSMELRKMAIQAVPRFYPHPFIYLSIYNPHSNLGKKLLYSILQHDVNKESCNLLPKYDRCYKPFLSIVYDIVFHIEWKINYYFFFLYVNHSQTHECGNWDCGCAILFWESRGLVQSQFPHSCICERFIKTLDLSIYIS